jgi:CubicO group peptidase (beta-lactamase class C family)
MFEAITRANPWVNGAVWLALAAVSPVASGQAPIPPDGTVRGSLGTRIDQHLNRAARFGFAGAVLIARDGEVILHKGYGLADREVAQPVTAETVFDIGSITKQFTAAAILKLEELGRLRVSDSIGRYFDAVPPEKSGVTIHHLLTHTAGLEDVFGGDYEPMPRDSLIRVALVSTLLWAPGTRYRYSNAGYSLLGAIVERVSGQPYERFLRTNLFNPAGLGPTGYRLVDWSHRRLAVGYRGSERWGTPLDFAWAADGPSWNLRANGGLLSTVGDLYRWHLALETDRVLSDSSRAKAFRKHVPESDGGESFYGYGWAVTPTTRGTTLVRHSGGNGYFFANFRRYLEDRVVVIFATNEYANRAVERDVERLVFGEPALGIPTGDASLSIAQLARYAGTYQLASGINFMIRTSSGGLEVLAADPEVATAFAPPLEAADRDLAGIDSVTARIVRAMMNGDFSPFREHFRPLSGLGVDRRVAFWTEWSRNSTSRFGAFRSSRVVGTVAGESRGVRGLHTYVVVRFARGARVVRLLHPTSGFDPGFFMEAVSPWELPGRHLLVPRSTTEFVTYSFAFGRAAHVIFEDDGDRVVGLTVPGGGRAEKVR